MSPDVAIYLADEQRSRRHGQRPLTGNSNSAEKSGPRPVPAALKRRA